MSIRGRFGGDFRDFPGNSGSPGGPHFGVLFRCFFVLFAALVFASILYGFWEAFLWIVASFWEVVLITFPGFA